MGNDDVVFQHNTYQGIEEDIYNSPWVQYTGVDGSRGHDEGFKWQSLEGGYYNPIAKFVPGGDFIVWMITNHNQLQSKPDNGGVGLLVKVGVFWYYIAGNMDGTSTLEWRYAKYASRPNTNPGTMTDTGLSDTQNNYHTIGLKFKTNGKVDILQGTTFAGALGYQSVPNDATVRASLSVVVADAMTWSGVTIDEAGHLYAKPQILGDTTCFFFRMYVDANDTIVNVGGDITDPGFIEMSSKSFLGTIGSAIATTNKQGISQMSTHLANIGKYINMYMDNGNIAFQGEMRRPKNIGPHKLQYVFVHNAQKFNRMSGPTNPLIESRFVRYLDWVDDTSENFLHDDNSIYPSYSTRIAVFKNTDLRKKTYHPGFTEALYVKDIIESERTGAGSNGTPVTPDETSGNIGHLYFFDEDEPTDNSDLAAATENHWACMMIPELSNDDSSIAEILTFEPFLDESPITPGYIEKATLSLIVSFRRLSIYDFSDVPDTNEYPLILGFNAGTAEYDTLRKIIATDAGTAGVAKGEDDIFEQNESPNITLDLELTEDQISNMFDFIDDNGTTNRYRFIVAVRSGRERQQDIPGEHTVHIRKAELILEFASDENETQGHFAIGPAQIDNTQLKLATTASLPLLPSQAGYSAGDNYQIVPTIEDYVTSMYATIKASKNLIWDLDMDLTGADVWGMVTNFADKYVVQVLQEITGTLKGVWYIDEDANTLVIKSVDNLTTATLTLVLASSLDNTIYFDIDGTKITNEVTVIGRTDKFSRAASSTTLSLGIETTIENAPSLIDLGSVQNRADDIALRTTDALNAFAMKLDIDNTDYTQLKKGVLVPVKLPTVADPYIMDDTLIVYGVEFVKGLTTGQKSIFVVHVRKRFA